MLCMKEEELRKRREKAKASETYMFFVQETVTHSWHFNCI